MTIHVITKQHENPVEFASTSREAADEHLATLGPGGFSIHAVELDMPSAMLPPLPPLFLQQAGFSLTPAQSAAVANALNINEPIILESQPKGVLHGKRQARPKT